MSDKFNFNTVKNFDAHIESSIQNYDTMHDQVIKFASYFINDSTNVVDIGCSTGKTLSILAPQYPNSNFIGIDESDLIPHKSLENLEFFKMDIVDTDIFNSSLILSLFTLQFLSPKKREQTINLVKKGLNKGGAFICCEKIHSETAIMQSAMDSIYYEFKGMSFNDNEILLKQRQLRRSLRLKTLNELITELSDIGKVEIFWKSLNFVGIVVIKD